MRRACTGRDAGIAGLHPLQAVLVDQPALVLTVQATACRRQAHCTALGTACWPTRAGGLGHSIGTRSQATANRWQSAARAAAGV
jgi:hypothetical protein